MKAFGWTVLGAFAAVALATGVVAQASGPWQHTTTDANRRDNWSWFDAAGLNNNPSARVAVSCVRGGCQGRALGVWYDAGAQRWAVFYQDRSAMQVGDIYEVYDRAVDLVQSADGGAVSVRGPAGGLVITPNYNPGGQGGVYVTAQLATTTAGDGSVLIAPANGGTWPAGASFNVARSGATLPSVNVITGSNTLVQQAAGTLLATSAPPRSASPPTPSTPDQRRLQRKLGQSEMPYGGAGLYQITPIFNPLTEVCAGWGLLRLPNMALQCQSLREPGGRGGHVLVMPHPAGGVTLRWHASAASAQQGSGRAEQCATTARGVLVGSPAVDIRQCELPAGATGWSDVGVADQVFGLRRVGNANTFRIEIIDTDRGLLCWTPRDINRPGQVGFFSGEIEILLEPCTNSPDQVFQFNRTGSVRGDFYAAESQALLGMNYETGEALDGSTQPFAVGRGIQGFAIAGAITQSIPMVDREVGDISCVRACMADRQCRAYSYRMPAIATGRATCELQSSIGMISQDPLAASRILRPDSYNPGAVSPLSP